MASWAINLMVFLFILAINTAKSFKIENTNIGFQKYPAESFSFENSNFPVQPFTRQYQNVNDGPIAGYPKVPPPNAYESGGADGDLLPPVEGPISSQERRNQFFRRSTNFKNMEIIPKPNYSFFSQSSWKGTNGDQEILKMLSENPLPSKTLRKEEAIDPKTGYPLFAQPSWKDAGGNGDILELPLEDAVEKTVEEKFDSNTGYPLQAQPFWKDAGGNEDILELPLEDSLPSKNSDNDNTVDPKTGYPLKAQPFWKDAGGNEDILELPLEDPVISKTSQNEDAIDPKTGYPLKAQPFWKDAGGNEDILELPLEDPQFSQTSSQSEDAIDPKTGYPLKAQPYWKDAGGNEDILELPLEDPVISKTSQNEDAVDPKTGYQLKAQPHWKDAGGNEDILELPMEDPLFSKTPQNEVARDSITGYPLTNQPHWKDTEENEDILELPFKNPGEYEEKKIDLKTGFSLISEPSWKDAGGKSEILDLPLQESTEKKKTDEKTADFYVAKPNWRGPNGDEEIINLPPENEFSQKSEIESQLVDPKFNHSILKSLTKNPSDVFNRSLSYFEKEMNSPFSYSFIGSNFDGENKNILQMPFKDLFNQKQERSREIIDEDLLTQLRPPTIESNYFSGFGNFPFNSMPLPFTQTPAFSDIKIFDNNRIPKLLPINSENTRQQRIYTLTYPNNAVATVSHSTNNNNKNVQKQPTGFTTFNQNQFSREKTQINSGNSFKSFPIIHTAENQQFKFYQPSD